MCNYIKSKPSSRPILCYHKITQYLQHHEILFIIQCLIKLVSITVTKFKSGPVSVNFYRQSIQGDHLSGNVGEFDDQNVRDFTKTRNCRGKIGLKLSIVCCIFASILDFAVNLCISFWFRIMHCCIPTPTTDNNTSTGMIRVTFNRDRSAVNCQGNVMELSGNFTVWRVVTLSICSKNY